MAIKDRQKEANLISCFVVSSHRQEETKATLMRSKHTLEKILMHRDIRKKSDILPAKVTKKWKITPVRKMAIKKTKI